MKIESMFKEDINRKINGVVKVDQDASDILIQEITEYVITTELKKHFTTFFNNYGDAFDQKTADIGVWISGFFGSGKSHFLKMLSYLLENKEVGGEKTVDRFRQKQGFVDDPATFMLIDKATKGETHTILFNIDIEGSINKDKTAVLRVFAKMFYNYLGFYGENLKVAKLEQFIAKKGKTDEFRRVFEEINGGSWLESRDAFAFYEDDVVQTLQKVLGMSESAAQNWFNGTETVETSIAQLVSEIKEYVDAQPDNFRLLFMVDEVGQYVGADTDLLINLQSLVEKIGSECEGKVWVVCTGQEAIDEIIKARENEFSRIQARFKTRLSLSSSSADEVIQKRVLLKKPEAESVLQQTYEENASGMRNLFSFSTDMKDIKGYRNATEYTQNFPFVPYQFILMQKVFSEIRKHGNSGKHLSGGERSMLSGFQEAAIAVKEKNEYALAPFYLFYNTVHTFLEGAIRRVIDRCDKASRDESDDIEPQDVNILKLLNLIRYVDDISATLDNIVILMADDIRMDKIIMREKVRGSLERLSKRNFIGKNGDVYRFLTDEEQDIQLEIRNTVVDTASVVEAIGHRIFNDIYTTKKYRYGKYDFAFDQMVDERTFGIATGGMRLQILTVATDSAEKNRLQLGSNSKGQAIVVLDDTQYFEFIEQALKIRKYVKLRNVALLPKSMQDIIQQHQQSADKLEKDAIDELKKAIEKAAYYVDGETVEIKSGEAKNKLDQALDFLVGRVYSKLNLIGKFAATDADIVSILNDQQALVEGIDANAGAAAEIEAYLEMRAKQHLPTSVAELQSRYQAVPYGWKEIDIAAVIAQLIHDQKVTIKYNGVTIQPTDSKLPDLLHKKSEIGKTLISKRQSIPLSKIREVREFLRDYFDEMDVPDDEDGLVAHIVEKFNDERIRFENLLKKYEEHTYPDKSLISSALEAIRKILAQKNDNLALIDYLIKQEEPLEKLKDRMAAIEEFFKNQVVLFDSAYKYEKRLRNDLDYINQNADAKKALDTIRLILMVHPTEPYNYKRIPELNALMATVSTEHEKMLAAKREYLYDIIRQCKDQIHSAVKNGDGKKYADQADTYYEDQRSKIAGMQVLALMDGLEPPMWTYKDEICEKIELVQRPPVVTPPKQPTSDQPAAPVKPKHIKQIHRQAIFPPRILESEADIDAYLAKVKEQMLKMMKDCDGIKLN